MTKMPDKTDEYIKTALPNGRRCWATVHLKRLRDNLAFYRAALPPDAQVMAVVKADAYGHKDTAVAPYLNGLGVRQFAVANIDEAVRLRESGVTGEILILGYTPVEAAGLLHAHGITQTILSPEYACALARAVPGPVSCVYAVDTGMRRIGLDADDPDAAERAIRSLPAPLRLVGLITHLAQADTPWDEESRRFTDGQIMKFEALLARFQDAGLTASSALNSAGGLYYCRSGSPTVRLGIVLYGLMPDRADLLPAGIRPVMDWHCAVAMVKAIGPGDTVGYGRTFRAEGPMRVATLSVGYADGYPRSLSNKGCVLLHGRRARILGRVCMDQMMVDVTDIPDARMGDTATLLGTDGQETLTADDLARWADTIGYEIVCGISPRVPRVIVP